MLCDDVEWWNGQGGDGRETQEVEDICMHRLPRLGSSKESDSKCRRCNRIRPDP